MTETDLHPHLHTSESAPVVSVIIPIYNAELHLEQALASIRAQSLTNLQIICVNDGSTDASSQILARHAEEDARIEVVNKPNGGYGSACNAGLERACGDWVAILEPDDYIERTAFERMVSFARNIQASTGDLADLVKCPYWRIVDADTPAETKRPCHFAGRIPHMHQPFHVNEAPILLRYHPSIWSALYRRSFLEEHAIRFTEAPGSAWTDNPFLAETLLQGKLAYLDEAFYCYRENTQDADAAYLRAHAHVPLDRWNEMMDVADRLQIHDADVLCQLYLRGLNYLARLHDANALSGDEYASCEHAVFARFSPDALEASALLSPAQKRRFTEVTGKPIQHMHATSHAYITLQDLICKIRSTGILRSAKRISGR